MVGWFGFWRDKGGLATTGAAFIALGAYSLVFLNGATSAWAKAVNAAGGTAPETLIGFPAIEPGRTLAALDRNGANDYLLWQAIDIPFAALNAAFAAAAIATGLRLLRWESSPWRGLLWLPLAYFCAELVENGLVSAFALGLVPGLGVAAIVQQAATTVKLCSGYAGLLGGLILLGAGLIAAAVRRIRGAERT